MREMKDSGIEWIGEIPADWGTRKNKYLLNSMYSGGTPSAGNSDFYAVDSGIPFVSISDMSSTDYVRATKKALTEEGRADKNLEILPIGTILYSIYATVGAVSELAIEATISQAMLALDLKTTVDKQYYKYCLCAMKDYIFGMANGNTQFNLNAEKVWNLAFPFPTIDEQHRISNSLDQRCAEIDAVIEETQATIEEYKKLKQSLITEAVTKGIRDDRPMKDSGIEWIGEIPAEWSIYRIANLYDERTERGEEELPILTVSINSGVSDHEIADEDKDRIYIRSEDRTKYSRVYPGDLTYNMMRAWQGAFGAVRVNGMVSPAYVVAKPKEGVKIDSRYIEALLRTPEATEEMHRYSRGIVDFRLRLYWPEFKNIRICLPSLEEQSEIASYIDHKCAEIDALIAKKTDLLDEMESYKKSVIYEYVTGKKECGAEEQVATAIIYPYYPAVLSTKQARFAQAVLMSRILDKCRKKMGRVKLEKMLYTIETSIGFDFETEYVRQAAGPLDDSIYECEGIISRKNKWYTKKTSKYGVSYAPAKDNSKYKQYYNKYFADYDSEIERIIGVFMDYNADQAEIVATLFAAWNDFIIDRKEFSDEELVDEVLNNWNDSKKRFAKDVWLRAIEQMRKNNIVPKGYGKHTIAK